MDLGDPKHGGKFQGLRRGKVNLTISMELGPQPLTVSGKPLVTQRDGLARRPSTCTGVREALELLPSGHRTLIDT